MNLEGTKKQIRNFAEKYAKSKQYKLNPNREELDMVIEGLAKNKIKYGKQYCPCRILFGDNSDKNKICPCKWHEKEINEIGHCKCLLFFKIEDL